MMLKITKCPTCASDNIKLACRDWTSTTAKGEAYTVPALEFYECPDCGEELYDRDAMRKIEAYSPTYAKKNKRKTQQNHDSNRTPQQT